MNLDFELTFKRGRDEYSADMRTTLESMSGISDSTTIVVEGLLRKDVPEKIDKNVSVRTNIKKSFKGSYGQKFSLSIPDGDLTLEAIRIGKELVGKYISSCINRSLYEDDVYERDLAGLIADLGGIDDEIVDKLRVHKGSLWRSLSFAKSDCVSVDFKFVNAARKLEMIKFTADNLEAFNLVLDDRIDDFNVAITRFNTLTGNGRLVVEDDNRTTAFGFSGTIKHVDYALKRTITNNLHANNGLDFDDLVMLPVKAKVYKTKSGRVAKLRVVELG